MIKIMFIHKDHKHQNFAANLAVAKTLTSTFNHPSIIYPSVNCFMVCMFTFLVMDLQHTRHQALHTLLPASRPTRPRPKDTRHRPTLHRLQPPPPTRRRTAHTLSSRPLETPRTAAATVSGKDVVLLFAAAACSTCASEEIRRDFRCCS